MSRRYSGPLYWIHDGPATLLVAQAVLFAAAIPVLWVAGRRMLGTTCAYAMACAYALSWPIAEAAAFQFHEFAFMPLLTALLFERWQAGRRSHVVLVAVLLLAVKEDVGLLVAGFGAALLWRRPWRPVAALLIIGGLAVTVIATRVVIPAFGGSPYRYWAYGGLGRDLGAALGHVAAHPLASLAVLVTPAAKVGTTLWLLAPFAFTSLASPFVLAALPMLLTRLLATDLPSWWGVHYHYNSAIVVPLLLAGADGARRIALVIAERRPGLDQRVVTRAWAGWLAIAAAVSVPQFALRSLFDPSFYSGTPRQEAAAGAAALIPDGALVEAANQLGPALTSRAKVVIWRDMPLRAPWVIADTGGPQPMFASRQAQLADVRLLRDCGYEQLYDRDGYLVLHAASPGSATPDLTPHRCAPDPLTPRSRRPSAARGDRASRPAPGCRRRPWRET
ncbi:DUF2079 domain-containing protein [Microbispora amethystogenes]|uniref:DUF2079 domain-containing protein n=1 Tax=Microbispora amethystogenes TaxID=1427754 RepID=UPI0033F8C12C